MAFKHKFGFGGLFYFNGDGNNRVNVCIDSGTDGTWYMFEFNSFGIANPTHTKDGTLLYSFKCNASGDFIISWGDTGKEQLLGIDAILVKSKDRKHVGTATWRNVLTRYEFNDLEWATVIIDAYGKGETEQCFLLEGLPENFIHYSFNELLTGVKE